MNEEARVRDVTANVEMSDGIGNASMTAPICSFLIPSRFRFNRLKKLIESIQIASEPDSYEVIVRLHDDDNQSLNAVSELFGYPNTRYIVGKTFKGYESLHIFTAELIEQAKGEWIWHLNDDMALFGTGWESQLRDMPKNALVQPEFHRLNNSEYLHDVSGSAPCHANDKSLAQMLRDTDNYAVDLVLYRHFAQKGAPIRFLSGMGIQHNWSGHSETWQQ